MFITSLLTLHLTAYEEIQEECKLQILTPSLQNRKVGKIRLSNGIEAYLISDPTTHESAAAISVGAGSWDDPKEYPGMAHFTEHMLFKGTSKYPDPASFMRFIMENGGTPNAYTAPDKTVYMFSIVNNCFEEALERFSYFFIDPLFAQSEVKKELHAVDQENKKNIECDSRRKYQIDKETGNPNHPNASFSTGNAETLKNIPSEAMHNWFENHYSASNMKLVIYSNLPLEKLKQIASEEFSKIPDRHIKKRSLDMPLFSNQQKGHIIYIQPIQNLSELILEWELNPKWIQDSSKSLDLICYLFNRSFPGSISSLLKEQNLITNLYAYEETLGNDVLNFGIDISLSDKGLKEKDKVISMIFEYIEYLKTHNIPKHLFDEMKLMSQLQYEYQEKQNLFETVSNHASNLQSEAINTYPEKMLMPTTFSKANIDAILQNFDPTSCHFTVIADSEKTHIPTTNSEKWFGAKYTIRQIPKNFIERLQKPKMQHSFKLPTNNPYLPKDLSIIDQSNFSATPEKLIENDYGIIYYIPQNPFQTPTICHHIQIRTPKLIPSLKNTLYSELFIHSFEESIEDLLSTAASANLNISLSYTKGGFLLITHGYSEKASFFIKTIIEKLKDFQPDENLFKKSYIDLTKKYENASKAMPAMQAYYMNLAILNSEKYQIKNLSNALKEITYTDFQTFAQDLFNKTYIRGIFGGNIDRTIAENLYLDIEHALRSHPYKQGQKDTTKIFTITDEGPYKVIEKGTMQGNAVALSIDQGEFTFKNYAMQSLISNVLREAFFTALRSEQKTGYLTKCPSHLLENRLFQFFFVLSNTHSSENLLFRFNFFLENFLQNINQTLPETRFETVKQSLLAEWKIPPQNLNELVGRDAHLAFLYKDFNWEQKTIEALENISYEETIQFAKKTLSPYNLKKIAVLYEGKISGKAFPSFEDISLDDLKMRGKYLK